MTVARQLSVILEINLVLKCDGDMYAMCRIKLKPHIGRWLLALKIESAVFKRRSQILRGVYGIVLCFIFLRFLECFKFKFPITLPMDSPPFRMLLSLNNYHLYYPPI